METNKKEPSAVLAAWLFIRLACGCGRIGLCASERIFKCDLHQQVNENGKSVAHECSVKDIAQRFTVAMTSM